MGDGNGTAGGTVMLKDINPGAGSSRTTQVSTAFASGSACGGHGPQRVARAHEIRANAIQSIPHSNAGAVMRNSGAGGNAVLLGWPWRAIGSHRQNINSIFLGP